MARGPKDYLDRATSPDATSEELRDLAASEYLFVRLAVAGHCSTPPDVLASLVPEAITDHGAEEMMLALAQNRSFPPSSLRRIALLVPSALHMRDTPSAFGAGIALFERADTPDAVLEELLSDELTTVEFRKVAARQTTHGAIRARLSADASSRVRRAATRGRVDP